MRVGSLLLTLAILVVPSGDSLLGANAANEKDASAVIPVFTLRGPYSETPRGEDLFLGSSAMSESFHQLITRLKKARDDKNVKAVVLLTTGTALGTGQVEEVRKVMNQIIEAGKPIRAHTESLSMRAYVLLSGATTISVVPTGDIWLTGLYAESLHVRGLLDKIGVEPDFLTCGRYKSAGETFTLKAPSPEADANFNWLLDGIFDSYVRLIAEGRSVERDEVRRWIDRGLFSPTEAKKLGIIDTIAYRHDFQEELEAEFGEGVEFDRKYAKEKGLEIDFSSPMGVLKFYADLLTGSTRKESKKDAVAIVHVEGPIVPGGRSPDAFPFGSVGIAYSTPIRKALDKVAEDDTIKAVVLRVNSPGGSAVASEIILQATRRVKEKKPLVVSMGDVAGSGGYYVACGTDTIFADPSTITASIGVVAGKLATTGMWQRLGVNWKEYERGENAGMLSSGRTFTDSQRQTVQAWMNEIYDVFKGHVLASRQGRLKKDLEDLAGGRVYTGRQAFELGLVDRLGGLEDAIRHAAKEADLEDYEVRVVPRPKNFAELLMSSMQGDDEDDESSLSLTVKDQLFTDSSSLIEAVLPHLRSLDPDRLRAMQVALSQLGVLQAERAVLAMPVVNIRDR